ncbi:hypothetical protein K503DRAFT_560672 [Rhizopogon vinicolor AM-OR11-026]|uniref:DUF6533 domain-containing protein n=1 Tax=Rhizopogon vinicolor AM-OR11-026 TaxID=1314800 RepID=A0A1B7MK78_9AGAM|nr:hypothetical protein K503DRAFT_560672 [Rhizopogon vinicolor AM-OR11-026]
MMPLSSSNAVVIRPTSWLFIDTIPITGQWKMTIVSDDPSWWPLIETNGIFTYFTFACLAAVIYDWALTFGQEVELVWRRRCSLMTVLYLILRYSGFLYPFTAMLSGLPSVSMADNVGTILAKSQGWSTVSFNTIVGVVMIARLYAMYEGSRKMLIFLIVMVVATTINSVVTIAIGSSHISGEELVLSGLHQCILLGNKQILVAETWIFGSVWEVLILCLAIWIAVKHFRELRRPSEEWTIGDCFTILIKTHVHYFVGFTTAACLNLGLLSPTFENSLTAETIYTGFIQLAQVVQLFVLGPRLILSIREHNAKLVADSDEGTAMSTMAFPECVEESTGIDV